jgi:hypothetical protein
MATPLNSYPQPPYPHDAVDLLAHDVTSMGAVLGIHPEISPEAEFHNRCTAVNKSAEPRQLCLLDADHTNLHRDITGDTWGDDPRDH